VSLAEIASGSYRDDPLTTVKPHDWPDVLDEDKYLALLDSLALY
jgi:hypothetical protein